MTWLVEQATRTLAELEPHKRPAVLERWARTEAADVDHWLSWVRGTEATGIDGRRRRVRPPGAPEGIRRRDVTAALAIAVHSHRGGTTP